MAIFITLQYMVQPAPCTQQEGFLCCVMQCRTVSFLRGCTDLCICICVFLFVNHTAVYSIVSLLCGLAQCSGHCTVAVITVALLNLYYTAVHRIPPVRMGAFSMYNIHCIAQLYHSSCGALQSTYCIVSFVCGWARGVQHCIPLV